MVYERLKTLTGNHITALAIDDLLKSAFEIEQTVDDAFRTELFQITDPHRKVPAYDGLQLINREVIIRYVRRETGEDAVRMDDGQRIYRPLRPDYRSRDR